jgi:hypothetical protein
MTDDFELTAPVKYVTVEALDDVNKAEVGTVFHETPSEIVKLRVLLAAPTVEVVLEGK